MERTTLARDEGAVTRVVKAVADAVGTSPNELPPLYRTVDPDALETVLDAPGACARFEYAGHVVEVRGDGTVSVAEAGSQG
ncbi:hypothetical protein G9464_00285 [Halostella sp. JP-L12]|uniref:HalOD1 output domain-containing protein n=1 Tax=Halostella TaxID=1843185 RepID=UPI000EF83233|nr:MULTISPECIES: HalOD1 output domain-containing protein [Halostella]NHN46034.1 hypothetical protein [Halostella sp. JP-L12]